LSTVAYLYCDITGHSGSLPISYFWQQLLIKANNIRAIKAISKAVDYSPHGPTNLADP
jgi:hypothetical protein